MSTNVLVEDLSVLPIAVQGLLEQRELARKAKNFTESDRLRDEIKTLGYLVNDLPRGKAGKPYGTKVLKIGDEDLKTAKSFLLLFGSGEIAPSSVDIYRQAFLALNKRHLKISLITTPAGFQSNVEHVYGEIKDFLLASLPDFNLTVNVIFANNSVDARNPEIVSQLDDSDVIFMGPGSPTYAVRHLNDTLLLSKIVELVKNGSTLILASAATISCSRYAMPVYEIFKVGEKVQWMDGLNVFKDIWQEKTIIPHFNNREGGADLDTSYCYIGKGRGEKLLSLLPHTTPVVAIDEHTCLIVDLDTKEESVRGKGGTYSLNK